MQKENNLWQKSYECNCHGEMIMMGYENDEKDGIPTVDLAFFKYGHEDSTLSFSGKLRWIWQMLTTGKPFLDEVMIDQPTAKRLGEDLIEFSNKKYDFGYNNITVKGIRIECDARIKELQESCKHVSSTWCEDMFAPGHFSGTRSRLCNICEKVLETK